MVAFSTLWESHPMNQSPPAEEPCRDANGASSFPNQCAIRMSTCFVTAGLSLASFRGAFCWYGHGRAHAIRAEEVGQWLNDTADFVGVAEIRKRSAGVIAAQAYATRQGVVLFRNFWGQGNQGDHVDLWNGSMMTHGAASYFERSEEVWFWDLD